MEDQQYPEGHEKELTTKINAVESRGCGMFDFLGKKEEKPQEDRNATMTDCDATQVTKCKEKKQEKPTLVEELHRSRSSSSSSSDEGGEKKKKGLMEKMKEKVSCQGEEQVTEVPVEKCDEMVNAEPTHPEEKKGILEKIKEKLPGQHKKEEECAPSTPPECAPDGHSPEGETKEKKGILDKIKEKLPGYHKNGEEEKKEN